EHELRAHHALEVDAVDDLLHRRQHLAGELQFSEAECAALAGRAQPAEEEPTICHSASRPRHPGITGSFLKWERNNQRSGFPSSSARIMPLPCSPPCSEISEIRSNISIGGSGSCGPSANNSPRPQASRSSYSKL